MEKRDLMMEKIKEHLPNLEFMRPIAGMFLMLWLQFVLLSKATSKKGKDVLYQIVCMLSKML
jgi:DNA-binding transcriptional MocR family regulator